MSLEQLFLFVSNKGCGDEKWGPGLAKAGKKQYYRRKQHIATSSVRNMSLSEVCYQPHGKLLTQ